MTAAEGAALGAVAVLLLGAVVALIVAALGARRETTLRLAKRAVDAEYVRLWRHESLSQRVTDIEERLDKIDQDAPA